ncbi:hypothetical protein [Paracoccus sp. SM22M-07]|uniref:hypothetical protein n=1 Tax=Paracoccus sp. SM22M-07 TaxID=1520813 RepID=UPI000930F3DE|nr:hypothetical protein [Paracoccus sp. SM22M-07]
MSGIEDLDEMILKCRDQKARDYISEAVGNYRAGSYRSAIVATWIAVCFDLIGKLRELSLAGDSEAERRTRDLDEINRTGELLRGLKFEKDIIEIAFKMEMISSVEKVDLLRLQHDRNRCAHPSLNSEGEKYSPPAELARLHIHSAVNHLLMHEPAQGKFALDRLYAQIRSDYFPTGYDETLKILQHGPLKKARPSLPRNLATVLLKEMFKERTDYLHKIKTINCLNAIHAMHFEEFTNAMHSHLSKQIENILDSDLHHAFHPICKVQNSWHALDFAQRDRLCRYVKNLPPIHVDDLNELLAFSPLKEAAATRLARMSLDELDKAYFIWLRTEVMDRLIELSLYSKDIESANKSIRNILIYQSDLTESQIVRLLTAINENQFLVASGELDNLIKCFRDSSAISFTRLEATLSEVGLERYLEIPF